MHGSVGLLDAIRPALGGSLSLFLPGSGQLVWRRVALALFFPSWLGFMAAIVWAVVTSFDRLAPTLALLGVPISVPLGALGAAYLACAGLHVAAVIDASSPRECPTLIAPHPLVAAMASALVPGWGQLLNGHRLRAALFLLSVWLVAGFWLAGSAAATGFLNAHVPAVSTWEQALRSPVFAWSARLTLPALIWVLAIYDATAGATARRRD